VRIVQHDVDDSDEEMLIQVLIIDYNVSDLIDDTLIVIIIIME